MWYNLTPAQYADGLRYSAERCDEQAKRHDADGKPWSAGEAARSRRNARRLRAMALLCDRSTVARAGGVDFRRLNDPTLRPEDEEHIVTSIEGETE